MTENKLKELINNDLQNENKVEQTEDDGRIIKLTKENINDFLSKHVCVVIDFYSDTCPPCHRMKPVLNELAEEFKGKIAFAKVHTKEERAIAEALQVKAHPTFYFFHEGFPILFFIGEKKKSDFIQLMKIQFPNLKEN
ncbi:MAG TPA: thioredoxin family protein [Candidatus Bathyarchaeia archaeon]|nr:thioredoxin family protein [Candidatus Bathyarchaeia archaeon]